LSGFVASFQRAVKGTLFFCAWYIFGRIISPGVRPLDGRHPENQSISVFYTRGRPAPPFLPPPLAPLPPSKPESENPPHRNEEECGRRSPFVSSLTASLLFLFLSLLFSLGSRGPIQLSCWCSHGGPFFFCAGSHPD